MCSPAGGLKTAKSFQCATAPIRGTRGQNRYFFFDRPLSGAPGAKIAPFSTKIGSLEPQQKIKISNFFQVRIFFVRWVPNRRNALPPPKKKRPYLRPQGHMGPQTGFTGSALSMRSNSVRGRFAQNGPQDGEDPFFRRFCPVSGPGRPRNFSKSPRPPKIQ